MTILELILLSIGLAMDCLAISIAGSIGYGRYNWPRILLIALFFGGFQGFMPVIGWAVGVNFVNIIGAYDHWIALGILGFIGTKMIMESFKDSDGESKYTPYGSLKMLIILSIADSIDALATGLLFITCSDILALGASIIALGSFVITIIGCVIGIEFGRRFKVNVNLIGGLILIGIGVKIFCEHTFF